MAKSGNKGLKRILKAAVYSWQGFKAAYRYEEAFRQELLLTILLFPASFFIAETAVELVLLLGSVLFLLTVEILNSAIEAVVDRFGDELHDLSGRAKDMGSAAVLLAIVTLILTWTAILFF